jgi:hypothetical protein
MENRTTNTETNKYPHRRTDNLTEDKSAIINGWGVDANPDNDPTYPMKDRTNEEQKGYSWERPTQQPIQMEILRSIERPNISAVFGTSTPLHGLSGQIRRFAFRYSESSWAHWVPLVLADRVDVVQGIINDLKKGIVPNIIVERGWRAEWKYDRKALLKRILVTAAITYGVVKLLSRKSRH